MECQICCETSKSIVHCRECLNKYCSECYINLYRTGEGIMVCPFCRYTFGDYCPNPDLIELAIKQIRYKLAGEWNKDILDQHFVRDFFNDVLPKLKKGGKKKRRKNRLP